MKRVLFFIIIFISTALSAWGENKPYGVLSDQDGDDIKETLTLMYGDVSGFGSYLDPTYYDVNGEMSRWVPRTGNDKSNITRVVFDPSFASATITCTKNWFSYFSNLKEIEGLSYFNTSLVTSMAGMFDSCYQLECLDLRTFDTHNVTNMSNMFSSCRKLSTIIVNPDLWNTDKVTSSGSMFFSCSKLEGEKGTDYSYSNSTDKTYARADGGPNSPGYLTRTYNYYIAEFDGNHTLTFKGSDTAPSDNQWNTANTSDSNPGWNTESVRLVRFEKSYMAASPISCYNWFKGCAKLRVISNFNFLNTSTVTNMEGMFHNCSSLAWVDLGNFRTCNVTNMSNMFSGCSNLSAIIANSGWNTDNVSSDDNMFSDCVSLVGDNGTTYNPEKTNKEYARIDVNDSKGYLIKSYDYYIAAYDSNTQTLTFKGSNTAADDNTTWDTSSTTTGSYGPKWPNNRVITKVVFDVTYAGAKPTSCGEWFKSLSSLKDISGLCYLNTCNVKNMNKMFYYCPRLTSLDLSYFDTGKVENMTDMFRQCSRLGYIIIDAGWNTAKVTESSGMFLLCNSLEGSNGTTFNANKTDKAYAHADRGTASPGYLTKVYNYYIAEYDGIGTITFKGIDSAPTDGQWNIADTQNTDPGWNSIKPSVTTIKIENAFSAARPKSCYNWFGGCTALNNIKGMQNLNTSFVGNMEKMFNGCGSLTTLNLSNFSTWRVTNMNSMFTGCSDLIAIIVNSETWSTANITSSDNMFQNCILLKGENGTTYNESFIAKEYAKPDGGIGDPGYFTKIHPYYIAEYNGSNTLTFKGVDNNTSSFSWDATSTSDYSSPSWCSYSSSVINVVFEPSFIPALPLSTYNWFYNFKNLEEIHNLEYLNTDKTQSMYGMFYYCEKLASIDLSSLNTSKVTNMSGMFSYCSSLKSLDLNGFVTNNVVNMSSMFSNCRNLSYILIGAGWNIENVSSSGSMFDSCSKLEGEKGTVYGWKNVDKTYARIDGGSEQPGYLTKIYDYYIVESDGHTLTFKGSDFAPAGGNQWSSNNTGTLVPGWNNEGNRAAIKAVKFEKTYRGAQPHSCYNWFSGFKNVVDFINLSCLNTSNVDNMESMFSGCVNLKAPDLSNFSTGKVTNMTSMFSGCSNLIAIIVNASTWQTNRVTTADNMFLNCSNLVGEKGTIYNENNIGISYAKVDGGNSAPGYLTKLYPYFVAYYNGTTLTFKGSDTQAPYNSSDTWNAIQISTSTPGWSDKRSNITKVVFEPSFIPARPTSTKYWFDNFSKLEDIENLSFLNTSEVVSMSQMFNYCISLKTIDLSNFNTSKVGEMNSMFSGCAGMTSLDMSSFDTGNVTTMAGMFSSCNNLYLLDLGSFNTSKVTGTSWMFDGCGSLTTILVDSEKCDLSNVTSSSYMFRNCVSLVGEKGTKYDSNHNDIGYAHIDGGLEGPGYFTKVYPHFMAEYDGNHTLTFKGCESVPSSPGKWDITNTGLSDPGWIGIAGSITSVKLEGSFIKALPKSCHAWFKGMNNLDANCIDLTYLNTNDVTDMSSMFEGCSNLTCLDLRSFNTSSVTGMANMFNGCSNLVYIIVDSEKWVTDNVNSETSLFDGCNQLMGGNGTVFTPESITLSYARIDGGNEHPGYLTKIYPYYLAVYKENNKTLSFKGSDNAPNAANYEWDAIVENNSNTPWYTYREGITNVVFDPSFASAQPASCKNWFSGFTNLTSLTGLHYLNTDRVKTMNNMFYYCKSLASIDISNFIIDKATTVADMFFNCSNLESLTLGSGFNTTAVTNFSSMFDYCYKLENVTIKGNTAPNIMENIFEGINGDMYSQNKILLVNGVYPDILNDQIFVDSDGYLVWKGGKFVTLNGKKGARVSVNIDNWTYGSEAQSPTLFGDDKNLISDNSVNVVYEYKNADDNSDYSALVPTLAGNYTLRASIDQFTISETSYLAMKPTCDFTIEKKSLGTGTSTIAESISCSIKDGDTEVANNTYVYDGSQKTPSVLLKYTKADESVETLNASEDGDYEVTYGPNNDVADNVVVTITATGKNYTGSIVKSFTMSPKELTNEMVTLNNGVYDYNGNTFIPNLTLSDQPGEVQLLTADDIVQEGCMTDPGNYTLVITGTRNYQGTVEKPYEIVYPLTPAKKYTTFYSPFDLQLPVSGLTAYTVTDVSNTTVTLTEQTSGIKAQTPLILVAESPNTKIQFHKAESVDLTGNSPDSKFKGVAFGGEGKTCTNSEDIFVLQNNGTGAEFVWANSGTVPVGKCYLDLGTTSGARNRSLSIVIDGNTTSLDDIINRDDTDDKWYDLQGCRIEQPQKKGLYILNGKKVVVK